MVWARLSRTQGGIVGRRQLRNAGLGDYDIDKLLRNHRLETTHIDRVYRATGAPHTAATDVWLAVLATNSPLSYVSGAAWWQMPAPADGLVHITRLDRRRLDWPPGVRVHRVALDRSAVTTHRGLPVTTRAETSLDCIGALPLPLARTFADRALQQGWLRMDDVTRRLDEQRGRWGNPQLRRIIAAVGDSAAAESERRLHRILRTDGISGWVANLAFLAGSVRYELDVAFPAQKIAVEVDGYAYHSVDGRFQADRTKQNALIASG